MSTSADLVLRGGTVLTVDPAFMVASAVAIRRGTIVGVGDDEDMKPLTGPGTTVIDIDGCTLLPGINDAHLHGLRYGMSRPPMALDLSAVSSIAEVVRAVARAAGAVPPGTWIRGRGWDAARLAECRDDPERSPHRRDLDEVSPDHPVLLTDFSGHAAWVNSAALAATGLGSKVASPPGGIVETDNGGPSGIVREAAVTVFNEAVPAPTDAERCAAIEAAVSECNRRGITSFTDPGLTVPEVRAYEKLAAEGRLSARVTALLLPQWPIGTAADFRNALDGWPSERVADRSRFHIAGVKIFADGIPPNRTSWMSEPYEGGGHGCLTTHGPTDDVRVAELHEMIAHAHRSGYQVGVHVTGDRAIDAVVAGFLKAQRDARNADPRHYVIHADFLSATSMKLLAENGFGANMNPTIKWVIADSEEDVVGSERAGYEMPYRDALAAGVPVTSGSDAPVTQPDWPQGISTMILREARGSGRVSGPDQRIGLAAALRTYTSNAAWQDCAEGWKGTIEAGKVADLCVLDGDLPTLDPHDIPQLAVRYTILDGKIVHAND
ncbi:amidohydrolase [Streptomyces ipomoeae]|nr:amidohydrolase [Streptomyces ipomoeae]MDX2821892.1 amidohydrolase [Streptomyces ipomoeae]MDX2874237.1 amidohydrolase [Streptomyces ipomoeae]